AAGLTGFRYARTFDYCEVALPESMAAYEAQLSKSTHSNFRRQQKAMVGKVDISYLQSSDSDALHDWLDTFFQLHERRWHDVGQPGSFAKQPLLQPFYRRFAPVALAKGWLRLYQLSIDGTPVAAQFCYEFGDRLLCVQEGFDPAGPSGSGNILRRAVINDCIEAGLGTYDFLAHSSAHKRRWRGESRAGQALFMGTRRWSNLALQWLAFWPTGRFIRHRRP
ncbi:MAG: GNAT family N-acetyltransferase, partial [Pseudomonadota bacterium]